MAKYRVECAAQDMADLIAEGKTRLMAEREVRKLHNLSDNELVDARDLYARMMEDV